MAEQASEERYTYRIAASRVRRDVTTIKRWRREGMPTERDELGRVVVRHSVLMAEFRKRLASDPVNQLRVQREMNTHAAELDK